MTNRIKAFQIDTADLASDPAFDISNIGLNDITDVTLTPNTGSPLLGSPHAENELLSFDSVTNQWINKTIPLAGMQALSTGSFTGGEILFGTLSGSPLSTALFTVTAGAGVIVDSYTDPENPTFSHVHWTEFTDEPLDNLLTDAITYIAIDNNGDIVQSALAFEPEDHRDYIVLGRVGHVDNVNVAAVRSHAHGVFDTSARLGDLAEAIGSFNITGNLYSYSEGSPAQFLTIDKSVGTSYRLGNNFQVSKKSPDITTDDADSDLTFKYSYLAVGSGHTVTADTTLIDPQNWDDGSGTLASVGVNQWQVQIIKFFPGITPITRIEYGQTLYGTKGDAIAAIADINHLHNPIFAEGIIRSYLVVQEGTLDLSLIAFAEFLEAGRFGAAGAVGSTPTSTTAEALATTSTSVDVAAATAPSNGQVLTATSGTAATWQTPLTASELFDNPLRGETALSYDATPNINFAGKPYQRVSITGNYAFGASSGLPADGVSKITLSIWPGAVTRTITYNASWTALGTPITSLTANKTLMVELYAWNHLETGISYRCTIQP